MVVAHPQTPEYFSSSKIEKRAVELVMNYERKQGKNPKDVSKERRGYDIESGDRLIEVKGQSAQKPDFIYLYKRTLEKLGDNILKYYIYLVYDMKREPKLKILPPEKIFGNIEIDSMFTLRGKVFKEIKEIEL